MRNREALQTHYNEMATRRYHQEAEAMRDEGDMLIPQPLTTRQLVVRLWVATALFYALLTAALVLLPRG